ncbi:sigma-70 family RNA polymerase sigma factor [Microtetraspora malaysiensis]|uniref:sigma-70 family RNA polymerase sigma factor n=1 Tax=Microtetraspora malaysiensis TaxID=161358 RepID=UPI003D8F86C1
MGPAVNSATEAFLAHRNLLFTVAYEMLGSAADAEDVLQETWLRWAGVDLGTVLDLRAYLIRITTRQALKRLRTLDRRKESYVGPWLPEPLLTSPDVAEDIELAESVSMAMLLVLETLGPTERAVFVLREVFALEYDEIAEAVDKSPAAVRQIAHRARSHVAARRPRGAVSAAQIRDALEAFQSAVETGDLQRLLDILAPDVVLVADGGGLKQAARRRFRGPDPRRARSVPERGRNGRSATPARHPRAGRRPRGRRRWPQAGRAGARRGSRPGGPRARQDRPGVAGAGTGQRPPGIDLPARRRPRHRHGGAHRRRSHHGALRRAQS